jgi:hypothetical protein
MKNSNKNPLQEWINSDSELNELLNDIDSKVIGEYEKAKVGFHKLSEKYNLPKYPDDVENRETIIVGDFHLYEPISMYEVLGKLKFVDNKSENLKSNVLFAAYLIINKLEPFIDEELDEYLKNDQLIGFGYKGEDVDVLMIPIKENESWFDKGCSYFTKNIDF